MSDPFVRRPDEAPEPAPVPPIVAAPLPYTPGEFVVLRDPLPGAEPMRLSGVLERQRFHPLLTAFLTFVGGFVIYQLVGTVVMLVAAIRSMGGEALDVESVLAAVQTDAFALFGGNAIGQVAGFLLFVLFMTWLHTPDVASYLRVRRIDGAQLGLAGVGLLTLLPLVSWLGELNARLPLPEAWQAWDEQQSALLEQVLGAELNVFYVLLVVALTPAICEEVMFRGYLQRQVERRLGVVWSIVLVGLVFGMFHLRPTQVLPLATLGMYLGFSVWVTGSLWAGVLIHLMNNGLAVIVSDYVSRSPDVDAVALESLAVPWYLAIVSAAVVAGVAFLMLRRRQALLADFPA
ncbi:MAG: type II CAAX endopeptidase family protein [Rhodothermales bacterium]